jgi:hypothetical protein
MSAMPASHGHSAACCNIPPVVSEGYTPKGSYEEVGGYKTCTFALHPDDCRLKTIASGEHTFA